MGIMASKDIENEWEHSLKILGSLASTCHMGTFAI